MRTVLLVADEHRPLFQETSKGVRSFAAEAGWQVVADAHFADRPFDAEAVDLIDGIIADHAGAVRAWADHVPVVLIGVGPENDRLPWVGPAPAAGGRLAFEHLREQGIEHLGTFHTMDPRYAAPRARAVAFAEAAAEADLTVHTFPNGPRTAQKWDLISQLLDLRDWLAAVAHPIGILAGDDEHGRRIALAADRAGLDVPHEVAILGYWNNPKLCEQAEPFLSSVDPDHFRIGFEAARLLADIIDGHRNPGQQVFVPPAGVAARASTDRRFVAYPVVQKAVRLAEHNLADDLSVDLLCAQAGVSDTYLNAQFRQATGTSTWDYIRQLRLKRAVELAKTTDLGLAEIAAEVGYRYGSHLSRDLKRFVGTSVRGLRKTP